LQKLITELERESLLVHVSVRLLVTDTSLALAVYYGMHTAHQYRLQGPGKWAGARDAILDIRQRIRGSLTCI